MANTTITEGTTSLARALGGLVATVMKLPLRIVAATIGLLGRPIYKMAERVALATAPSAASIEARLERRFSRDMDPLLRGDLRAAAEQNWPASDWPTLYQDVPDDLRRPPMLDGRLLGGMSLAWLADRVVHPSVLRQAVAAGRASALTALIAGVAAVILFWTVLTPAVGPMFGLNPDRMSPLELFSWSAPADAPVLGALPSGEHAIKASVGAGFVAKAIALNGLTLVASLLPIIAGLLLISWGMFRIGRAAAFDGYLAAVATPWQISTKVSETRYAYRAEDRRMTYDAYRKQVETATGVDAGQPLTLLGSAKGVTRYRGDQSAPWRGQDVKMSLSDQFQGLIAFGGTGENKTNGVIKPIFKQLIAAKTKEGNRLGFYVADDKSVLWRDLLPKVEAAGRMDDLRVIGTGEGQFGVDLMEDFEPIQAASVLKSVLAQLNGGGGSKDAFWSDMAVMVIQHVATIAKAWEQLPQGQAYWRETDTRPYSIWWIYQAVTKESMWDNAIKDIFEAMSDEKFDTIGTHIHSEALWASISWLLGTWTTTAEQTKSGIVSSVSQLLDGIGSADAVRDRFCRGKSHHTAAEQRPVIHLREALDGRIVMVAISALEFGTAAKVVLIVLKSALYRAARLREMAIGRKACQAKPCAVIIDEYQGVATADTSGVSCSSFWPVARSTGVFAACMATQTIGGLEASVGKEAAAQIIAQFRSKVILRVEDYSAGGSPTTLEYAVKLAGEFERARTFEGGQYESPESRFELTGFDPFQATVPYTVSYSGGWFARLLEAGGIGGNLPAMQSLREVGSSGYRMDDRFIPGRSLNDGPGAQMSAMQAAAWRQEDLDRQYLEKGISKEPAIGVTDLLGMGRWHAYVHVQRAGARVQDIIELRPDYE